MNTRYLHHIEAKWKVALPKCFSELEAHVLPAAHVRLADGKLFSLPYPPLRDHEIVSAADIALDWGLPSRVVPIIGDFHDLICLDYRACSTPSVIALDDNRKETVLFGTLDEFICGLTIVPEKPIHPLDIIESESSLDF